MFFFLGTVRVLYGLWCYFRNNHTGLQWFIKRSKCGVLIAGNKTRMMCEWSPEFSNVTGENAVIIKLALETAIQPLMKVQPLIMNKK